MYFISGKNQLELFPASVLLKATKFVFAELFVELSTLKNFNSGSLVQLIFQFPVDESQSLLSSSVPLRVIDVTI